MVAVGLSPRTESKHTIRRRVATAELSTGTEEFNRRDATRDNFDWSLRGLKSTASFTASLREAQISCDLHRRTFRDIKETAMIQLGIAPIAFCDV